MVGRTWACGGPLSLWQRLRAGKVMGKWKHEQWVMRLRRTPSLECEEGILREGREGLVVPKAWGKGGAQALCRMPRMPGRMRRGVGSWDTVTPVTPFLQLLATLTTPIPAGCDQAGGKMITRGVGLWRREQICAGGTRSQVVPLRTVPPVSRRLLTFVVQEENRSQGNREGGLPNRRETGLLLPPVHRTYSNFRN